MTAEGWRKYIGAVSLITGTVIGVGVFGLPYLAAKAGFLVVAAYLAWGTVTAILTSLVFGELMFRSRERHRVPGYVAQYLGAGWGRVVYVSATVGLLGGQLVYLLVGGHFLHALLGPHLGGSEPWYVIAYAVIGGVLIYGSGRTLAHSELALLPVMLLAMGLIIASASTVADWTRLLPVNATYLLAPYGVVMFSIWGLSAVGETRDYLGSRFAPLLKPAVITSYLICSGSYLLFTASILAATGDAATPDALGGLRARLGGPLVSAFYVFGVFTTFTSYISIGQTVKKIFVYDARWPNGQAWLLTAVLPPALYAAGVTDFLLIMGLIGSVTLGVDTIGLLAAYLRARQQRSARVLPYALHPSRSAIAAMVALFLLGILSALVQHLTPIT